MTQQQYMRFYLAVQDVRASGWYVRQNPVSSENTVAGFHIEGQETRTPLTITLARDLMAYAKNTLKIKSCQIVNEGGNIVDSYDLSGVGWKEQITRANQHRSHEYRGLKILEDRATGKFWHKFHWPLVGGSDRSISADSCEGIVERLRELGGTIPDYVRMFLDRVEPEPIAEASQVQGAEASAPLPSEIVISGVTYHLRPESERIYRTDREPSQESLPSEVAASKSIDPHAFFLKVARLTEHGSKD